MSDYLKKHHLSVDLETYSDVDIKKAGMYRYVQSPNFEILLFAYSVDGALVQVVDMAQGETIPQHILSALADPRYLKHAYNAAFEWYCLSKFVGMQLPPSQWRDTMLHGLYAGYPAGLDATGRALGIPEDKQKLTTGKALIRYFCAPCKPTKANGGRTRNYPHHDPEKWELFKAYNGQDVVAEMEIDAACLRSLCRISFKSSGKRISLSRARRGCRYGLLRRRTGAWQHHSRAAHRRGRPSLGIGQPQQRQAACSVVVRRDR